MRKKEKKASPSKQSRISRRNRWLIGVAAVLLAGAISLIVFIPTLNDTTFGPDRSVIPHKPITLEFMKQGELSFLNAQGAILARLDIEIAEDEATRERGLMYRESLAEHQGMLFVFHEDEPRSFWMKNTPLPLDMLFVDSNNRIVAIHQNTIPYSEQEYVCTQHARYVVETNAGFVAKHGIALGDRIDWRRD